MTTRALGCFAYTLYGSLGSLARTILKVSFETGLVLTALDLRYEVAFLTEISH